MTERFRVETDDARPVTAIAYPTEAPGLGATMILAHGAGAGQTNGFLVRFATALAARGLDIVTFNFPYAEQGRRAPDPTAVLEGCYRSVIGAVATHPTYGGRPLFIGGKSMGGRIATQVAADERNPLPPDVKGIVLLGYPLHPPGKPAQRRSRHLPAIRVPMLFVQGSRDPFGTDAELASTLDPIGKLADLHIVDGGDHSFGVGKRAAISQEQVFAGIQNRIIAWISERCGAHRR